MSKILTIGSTSKDIFFPTKDGVITNTPEDLLAQKKISFEFGAKYHINERFESLGGCSSNVAAGLAKLDLEVACYTTIGDDSIGSWIMQEMKDAHIDTNLLCAEKKCQSDLSLILVDTQSAERVIFTNQIANQKMCFDASKIGNPHWIFIGDLNGNWQQTIDEIIKAARDKKSWVAFNPRQKTIHDDVNKIIETIEKCELLFVNKDEAIEIVSGCGEIPVRELLENEEYLLKVLHRLGANTVTITDGTRGVWVYDGMQILHADAIIKKAVDTTGAGDAFTSGFFAAYLKRHDLETCLKWGVANSSSAVMQYGGQKGLLAEKEINKVVSEIIVKSSI